MRLILGLDAPSSGQVTVNGRRYVEYRRPLFEMGALLESRAAHPGRSAYNHLLCLALSNGIGRSRVGEVLDLVGLSRVASRRVVGGFSLGMSQRLGIAAAMLGDPPVLILDEPVNGLDPEGVLWIRTLMKSLAGEGRTVSVSSHLMSEMAITADRLIIIGRGRLIAQTTVADFLAGGAGSYVRAGSASSPSAPSPPGPAPPTPTRSSAPSAWSPPPLPCATPRRRDRRTPGVAERSLRTGYRPKT
jgi:ABC-2 type transport system ATP-binding protein